jgi:hypothetical protein
MVSRPDEPIEGKPGPDGGLPPDAPKDEDGPIDVSMDKLRSRPDDDEPAGEDEPPPDERDD